MIEGAQKAGIPCNLCGYMLIVIDDVVTCQNKKCKNHLKAVRPK